MDLYIKAYHLNHCIGCFSCMHLSIFNTLQHFCHGGETHFLVFAQTLL